MTGILYIVSTPIGNLGDMTYRAVEILRTVSVIACEDTRQTGKLLAHFDIRTPLCSYHEHNEAERASDLVARLVHGEPVAIVSDAGTPLISDPGYRLVQAAISAGVRVEPIPGASALLAALAVSGLPTDMFVFAGFLPPKSGQRLKRLRELASLAATLVLYEAPHRIVETLEAISEVFGDAPVVAGREITKLHEEFLRGTAREIRDVLASRDSIRGELTLVVGLPKQVSDATQVSLPEAVLQLERGGMGRMEAIKAVAKARGLPKRTVYQSVESSDVH